MSSFSNTGNQSVVPAITQLATNMSAASLPSLEHVRPGPFNGLEYNGADGQIDDSISPLSCHPDDLNNVQLTVPRRAASPSRQALGARLLSSLSGGQPSAAALKLKGSVLQARATSLAAFVPRLSNSNVATPEKAQTPKKLFGDFFNGESAPIRLGAPVSPAKEPEESDVVIDYRPSYTERPAYMQRRSTFQTPSSPPAMNKTSSWFGRKQASTTPTKPQLQDDLSTLNINGSLFPHGPADPLNPSAFNDLLLNATNLLQRMQAGYKEKVAYIASIQPEIDARHEEAEEAETRATHLKLQLEDMARQAQERETAMHELSCQLLEEKVKAQEAREAAARSVRLVPTTIDDGDEDASQTRVKRTSSGSVSDSGFESDRESIFSANSGAETPLSPAMSVASVSNQCQPAAWTLRQHIERNAVKRRDTTSTTSSNNVPTNNAPVRPRLGREGAAWATVETLRSENGALRSQMDGMQRELQGCIDLLSGLGGL